MGSQDQGSNAAAAPGASEGTSKRTLAIVAVVVLLIGAGIGAWALTRDDEGDVVATATSAPPAPTTGVPVTEPATPTTTTTAATTTSAPAAMPLVLTPQGLGDLTVSMSFDAASATGMIGPDQPGCELAGPGDRFAPLTVDGLEGGASFFDGELYAISLRTGPVIVPDATVGMAYDDLLAAVGTSLDGAGDGAWQATLDTETEEVFGIWVVTLTEQATGESLDLVVDAETGRVDQAYAPAVSFCE
jgi:hypothetical protein